MPLSRKSLRRNPTDMVKLQGFSQQSTGIKKTGSSRHWHLWEAIRDTREQLSLWQAQVDQVENLFRSIILPREHRMTDAFCSVTDTLVEHFAFSDLNPPEQSLLGLWITENLKTLCTHPFASETKRSALLERWHDLLAVDAPIENQLARLARQYDIMGQDSNSMQRDSSQDCEHDTGDSADTESDDTDVTFDFGWHKKNEDNKPPASERAKPENTQKPQERQAKLPRGEAQHNLDEKINVLSVDRLFRQLARVLHPDRELDESLKAEKHVLMSQCLQARLDKDINTLLTLYCEYVGELPDELTDEGHEELISALQLQLKQLQQELRSKRFGNPLHAQIVERYGAENQTICQERIAQHARSLDQETDQFNQLQSSLGSESGLQTALENRRAIELDRMAINEMTGMS